MSRPFDEARYQGLLEGLDASEVKFSETLAVTRCDSEYFRPGFLALQKRLATLPHVQLGNAAKLVAGPFGSEFHVENYNEQSPYRYIRGKDVKSFFVESNDNVHIPEADYLRLAEYSIQEEDVLVSVVGTLGNSCIVTTNDVPAIFSCKSTIVRKPKVNPFYLVAYLNSDPGRSLLMRNARGTVQLGLNLPDLRQLLIPSFSKQVQEAIERVIKTAQHSLAVSKESMTGAGQTLLCALGLENWQPPEPLSYTYSSRDAFAAGRLDAEYFAPRVAELMRRLNRDGSTVGSVAPARHERFVPRSNGEFAYIEIGGVRADGTAEAECVPHTEAPSRATQFVRRNDIVTSTVRPIRRLSALINPEQDGAVCSSGFVVLQPRSLAPEVLLTYLRLPAVCELMDLHTSASLYPAIAEADLLAMPIPAIDGDTQAKVVAAVRSAHQSRRRAIELLDAAKRAVEIAIEESESVALAYLEAVAGNSQPCEDSAHDTPPTPATRPTPEPMARPPRGRGQPARRLPGKGDGLHADLDGAGKRAGRPRAGASPADSTRPLDATRELATAAGRLAYTQVAERLAAKVADCLDELLDNDPQAIAITPAWLRDIHRRIAGDLFPDWAGRFRTTDVQVGTHQPPAARDVPVRIEDYCLDLEERLRHVTDAASVAALLAWADWRFQWIHPFKDFNGRVGRILLVALGYKLGLPPLVPSAAADDKAAYFEALRAADGGSLAPLQEFWLGRLID